MSSIRGGRSRHVRRFQLVCILGLAGRVSPRGAFIYYCAFIFHVRLCIGGQAALARAGIIPDPGDKPEIVNPRHYECYPMYPSVYPYLVYTFL